MYQRVSSLVPRLCPFFIVCSTEMGEAPGIIPVSDVEGREKVEKTYLSVGGSSKCAHARSCAINSACFGRSPVWLLFLVAWKPYSVGQFARYSEKVTLIFKRLTIACRTAR